jgi:hypothetical protein
MTALRIVLEAEQGHTAGARKNPHLVQSALYVWTEKERLMPHCTESIEVASRSKLLSQVRR